VDSTSQSSRESSGSRMWGKAWPYLRLPRGGHPCGQHAYPSRRLVCLARSPTHRRVAAPVHPGINFPAWSVERHRALIERRAGGVWACCLSAKKVARMNRIGSTSIFHWEHWVGSTRGWAETAFGDFDESLEWRRPLDDWLAELGRHVYEHVRFRLELPDPTN